MDPAVKILQALQTLQARALELGARVRVVATSAVAWITVATTVATAYAVPALTDLYGADHWSVQVVLQLVALAVGAGQIIRRVTAVPTGERGILPAGDRGAVPVVTVLLVLVVVLLVLALVGCDDTGWPDYIVTR